MTRRPTSLLGVAVLVAVVGWLTWSSGAPGQLTHDQVRQSLGTIDSLRAEAHHLDKIIAVGKDFPRTTSVRAAELAKALDDEAASLGEAQIPQADRLRAAAGATKAQREARRLRHLAANPSTSPGSHA